MENSRYSAVGNANKGSGANALVAPMASRLVTSVLLQTRGLRRSEGPGSGTVWVSVSAVVGQNR